MLKIANTKSLLTLLMLGATTLLSGCQVDFSNGSFSSETVNEKIYSFDAVKQIAPSITADDDGSAMLQSTYTISPSNHLLMRLETMDEKISNLVLSDTNPLKVKITVLNSADTSAAQSALRLCPITRNWMMLATWTRAHPFNSAGVWSAPGGDYQNSDCVSATVASESVIEFKMNNWINNDVRGRGLNYGVILISDTEIQIYGDEASSNSPRVSWSESI